MGISRFSLLLLVIKALEGTALQPGHSAFNRPATLSNARHIIAQPLKYRDRDGDTEELVSSMPSHGHAPKTNENDWFGNTGVNMPILKSLAVSQTAALVVCSGVTAAALAVTGYPIDFAALHWNGNENFFSPLDFTMSPIRVVEGFLAAAPMIFLGNKIEHAESRDCSHVNFSTMNMVMALFGRREHDSATDIDDHPILQAETPMLYVLLLAAGLALITALSEELIFRGLIPTAIFHQVRSVPIALFGQAALFGLGHISPQAKVGENKVVAGLQSINAFWHGLIYILTGGDILPCIVSHFVYDWHVFMETWMTTNSQMDYTNNVSLKKLSPMEERELRKIKLEAGPSLTNETLAFARRFFYAFDSNHCSSLSKSDVQRAVSYAFLHDDKQPTEVRVTALFDKILQSREDPELVAHGNVDRRLVLPEFLRLLFLLKASPETVF